MARNDADVLMGWRVKRADTLLRRTLSRFFYLLYQALYRVPVHDPSCPYILSHKKVIERLVPELGVMQEGFWWEFVARTHRRGYSLRELPVHHRLRGRRDQVYKSARCRGSSSATFSACSKSGIKRGAQGSPEV